MSFLGDSLYKQLIGEFPKDDLLRLKCYVALGRSTLFSRDFRRAEEYYASVLAYDPTPGVPLGVEESIASEEFLPPVGTEPAIKECFDLKVREIRLGSPSTDGPRKEMRSYYKR